MLSSHGPARIHYSATCAVSACARLRRDVEPFWTAGSKTFVDDLIQIAGGTNVFADLPTPWAEVSLEAIILRQPDIIIVAQPPQRDAAREWLRHAGWLGLRAVQANRVFFVEADRFNRPGPNVVESAQRLAALLHPGSQE
jgi:iron complex transport system substrate-binding protein